MTEPSEPNRLAAQVESTIAVLTAERAGVPVGERRALNRAIHRHQQLLHWCQTRAAYRPDPADAERGREGTA